MRRILLIITSLLLLLLVDFNKSKALENIDTENNVSKIISTYYNDGVYRKDTTINLSAAGVKDLAKHFHLETHLKRTTYYVKDSLWMSQGLGDDVKYSYYGTSYENGKPNGLTYGTTYNYLTPPIDLVVALSGDGQNSMEEYYITLKDILEYDSSVWEYENGVYTTTNSEMMEYFLFFTAPCLYSTVIDTLIFDYKKATIEIVDNNLKLSLWVYSTDCGYILGGKDAVVDGGVILSEAIIYNSSINGVEVDIYPGITNADIVEFNGNIYTYGGYDGSKRTDSVYCYNIKDNKLYELDVKLADPSTSHRTYLYGGKVYIFGGTTGKSKLSTIQVHDLVNQTMQVLDTQLLFGIHCQQIGYYKNKVYFAGAQTSNGAISGIYEVDLDTLEMIKLDIELPTVVFKGGWCVVGEYLYVIGGTMGPRLKTIYRFNMETKEVLTMNAKLPAAISQSRAVYDGMGNIYIYGGTFEGNILSDEIYKYNIEKDEIVTLPYKLPVAIANTSVCYIDGVTYIIGGDNATQNLILKHENDTLTHLFE